MSQKKYISLSSLETFLKKLPEKFSPLEHKHKLEDIKDYQIDNALSNSSENPVQNKIINEEFEAVSDAMGALELAIDNKAKVVIQDTPPNDTNAIWIDLADNNADELNIVKTVNGLEPDENGNIQLADAPTFTISGTTLIISNVIVKQQPIAYAVYSETDNSLTFYKTTDAIIEGSTYNDKVATAVYTGIETAIYNKSSLPWKDYSSSIASVTVADEGIAPANTAYWFFNLRNCTSMDLTKLDTLNVTDMRSMFRSCKMLESITFGDGWNTSNVTNMNFMFDMCSKLTELDLSSFNTQNVTSMSSMFSSCSALTNLDLSNFNTQNVTDMSGMFYDCSNLTVNCSGWNVDKVTDHTSFNYNASGVIAPRTWCPVIIVNTPASADKNDPTVTNNATYTVSGTVSDDTGVASVTVNGVPATVNPDGSWSADITLIVNKLTEVVVVATDNVGNTSSKTRFAIFEKIIEPPTLVVKTPAGTSSENPINAANSTYTVSGTVFDDNGVKSVTVNGVPATVNSNGTWSADITLEDGVVKEVIVVATNNAGKTTTVKRYVEYNSQATAYAVYSADDKSLTFYRTTDTITGGQPYRGKTATRVWTGFEEEIIGDNSYAVDWNSYDFVSVIFKDEISPKDVSFWFRYEPTLINMDLTNLNTSKVTDMKYMFDQCTVLTELDLSGFNTQNVTNMQSMFNLCSALTSVGDISGWNTQNVTNMSDMFYRCSELESVGDISGWDTSNVTNMSAMFRNCKALTADCSDWNVDKVTSYGNFNYQAPGVIAPTWKN